MDVTERVAEVMAVALGGGEASGWDWTRARRMADALEEAGFLGPQLTPEQGLNDVLEPKRIEDRAQRLGEPWIDAVDLRTILLEWIAFKQQALDPNPFQIREVKKLALSLIAERGGTDG